MSPGCDGTPRLGQLWQKHLARVSAAEGEPKGLDCAQYDCKSAADGHRLSCSGKAGKLLNGVPLFSQNRGLKNKTASIV